MNDLISRQAAIEALAKFIPYAIYDVSTESYTNGLTDAYNLICQLPAVQPQRKTDEWCTDCKEYDQQKHSCPRWNRVIRQTIKELKSERSEQQWIPFETRPLTEEEKEEHPEWDCIINCKLPDDGQRILVTIRIRGHEEVQQDEFYSDDGSYLDSGYEIGTEAVAWQPLPEPYKEAKE